MSKLSNEIGSGIMTRPMILGAGVSQPYDHVYGRVQCRSLRLSKYEDYSSLASSSPSEPDSDSGASGVSGASSEISSTALGLLTAATGRS